MAITRITRGSSQESDASTSRQKRARIYKDSTPTISRGHRHKTSTSELDRILEQSEPELPYQKEHTGPADRVRRSDGSNLSGTTVLGGSDHDPDPFEVAKKHVQLLMASSGLDPAALIQVLSQEAGVTMNNGATVKKAPAAKRAPRKSAVKSKGATKHLKRLAQGGKVPQQSHDRMAPVATMTGVQIPLMPGMLDEFQGHGIEREQTFIPNQSVQGVEPASPGGMARRAQLEQDNSLRPLSYSDQENQTLSGPQNASPPILRRRFDQTQAGASRLGPDDELDGSQGGVPLGELPQNRKRGREQEVHGDYALAGETIENPSFGMDREALDATGRRLISSIQDQSHIDPMLRELTETMDAQHGNWDDMRESDSQAQNPENALEPQSKKEADKSVTQQANERAKRLVALARMNKTPRTRRNWTDAEVEHLIHYVGITGPRYAAIKALATADGILMERNQVDLKDKVRNIKMDYLKGKALLPKNFRDFPLNKKDKQRLVDLGIDYEEANREFGDQDQNDPAVVEGYPGNYDPALEEHETQIRAVLAEVGSQPPEDSRPTPEPTNAPLIEQDASQQHNTQHQLMTQQARDSEGLSPQDLAQAVQEQTARDDAHEQLIAQQRIHRYQIPQEHMQLRQFAPMQATPQSAQRQVKAEHESFHPRG